MRRLPTLPALLSLGTLAFAVAACEREDRKFETSPPSGSPVGVVRVGTLQPGPALATTTTVGPYDQNAYSVSEGQRLFGWYNCAGCHANGGGGMGPPLIDDQWIYGSAPENIYATIMQGRPNGMPSFAGRIPNSQVWQIVAYVRSLSGLTSTGTRSSRTDHMMYQPGSQSLAKPASPKQTFRPPAAEQP